MRNYIEINKDLLPYHFNILLADEWYGLYVAYNKTGKMFTVSLYKDDELIASEPLILGAPLFRDVYQPGKFPSIELVPYAPDENITEITFENLGESVYLTVDDEGESADG